MSAADGKLIINNERGIFSVNVWLAASDSSSLLQLILSSAEEKKNSINLQSVSISKSAPLRPHNMAPWKNWKVLWTVAAPTIHLLSFLMGSHI